MLRRNIKITFRLNTKEQQRLKSSAKKTGLSQEAYIRTLLNGYSPKETPPLEYHRLIRELNAIGNNLHQIAARANATGFFLKEDYALNYRRLMEKVLEIQEAVTQAERI